MPSRFTSNSVFIDWYWMLSGHVVKNLKSRIWDPKVKVKSLTRVRLFATPWTVAYQAPPSMGFSRKECWSGLPLPSPGDPPDPGMEPKSPTLQTDALPSEPQRSCPLCLVLFCTVMPKDLRSNAIKWNCNHFGICFKHQNPVCLESKPLIAQVTLQTIVTTQQHISF